MEKRKKHWDVIIIGAGQSGLASGYYLKKSKLDFVILDENENIGDSWRKRWDSLHLFTPSKYDGLPGMKFPLSGDGFPGKDQVADFFKDYVEKFEIPVKLNVKTLGLTLEKSGKFIINTTDGNYTADKVVVATGTHPNPKIPAFSSELSNQVLQLHSSKYKNPDFLPEGDVLVVGAGTSGVEIAIEISKFRKTYISGNSTFHIPDKIFKYAGGLYWWFVINVLTINTPIGKKVKEKVLHGGGPLIKISVEDLDKAGVIRVPRMKGVKNGLPEMEDDTVLNVSTIIWSTGFKPDFSWIRLDGFDSSAWPVTNRGISGNQKGLYFVGMPFQFGLSSGFLGGVGRDAEYVIHDLVKK